MKKILISLLLVLLLAGQVFAGGQIIVMKKKAAGASCTIGSGDNWVNVDATDYYSGTTTEDQNFQEVANAASKNICRIDVVLENVGVTQNVQIKLKSGVGGTTYGTSDTVSVVGDVGGPSEYTFTFSPAVTVPGDFIVSVIYAGGANRHYCAYTASGGANDKYFGGTSYKATTGNTERGQDWAMEIFYEQ